MADRVIAAGLLVLVACAPGEEWIDPGLEPGEVLIVAALDARGQVERSALFGAAEPIHIEIPKGGTLVGFAFPESGLIRASGEVADLGTLTVRSAGAASINPSSCDRCFGLAASEPQVLRPGESCPPPAFARAIVLHGEAPEEWIAPTRAQIRIDAPEPCPCHVDASPPTPSTRELELRPVGNEGGFWPAEMIVQTSSGTIGVFGEHLAQSFGEGGQLLGRRDGPFVFPGPLQAITTLDDGFLLFTHDNAGPQEERAFAFNADLSERTPPTINFRARTALELPSQSIHLVAGETLTNLAEPKLSACEHQGDNWSCSDLSALLDPDRGSILHFVSSPQGVVIGDQFYRTVLVVENVPPPSEIRGVESTGTGSFASGRIRTSNGGSSRWRRLPYPAELSARGTRLAATDDGVVFVCLPVGEGELLALAVGSAFFDSDSTDPWIRTGVSGAECIGLLPLEHEMQVIYRDGHTAICASSDPTNCRAGPPAPLEDEVGDLLGPVPGRELSFAPDRIRARRRGESDWTPLYGRTGPTSPIEQITTVEDDVIVFRANGQISRVVLPHEPSSVSEESPILATERPAHAASFDATRREVTVAVRCVDPNDPELIVFDPDSPNPRAIDLDPKEPCREVLLVENVAPGSTLLADAQGQLFLLDDDDHVEPVEIDWDDPDTSEIESPPFEYEWLSSHAVSGVAFVTGTNGAFVRMDVHRRPAVATAIFLGRPSQSIWTPDSPIDDRPEPRGLAARCPDVAVLGNRGWQRATFEVGELWRVAPGAPSLREGLAPLEVLDEPRNAVAWGSYSTPTRYTPVGLFGGDRDWTIFYFRDSLHQVGAGRRIRLVGLTISDGAELSGDRFVLSTEHGSLFVGTRRPP